MNAAADPSSPQSVLRECVTRSVRKYLADLDDHPDGELHALMVREVEIPLLVEVMRHCDGNQTRAADALGINRATLRKKLRYYELD